MKRRPTTPIEHGHNRYFKARPRVDPADLARQQEVSNIGYNLPILEKQLDSIKQQLQQTKGPEDLRQAEEEFKILDQQLQIIQEDVWKTDLAAQYGKKTKELVAKRDQLLDTFRSLGMDPKSYDAP